MSRADFSKLPRDCDVSGSLNLFSRGVGIPGPRKCNASREFSRSSSVTVGEIVELFGDAEKLRAAVTELQAELYAA